MVKENTSTTKESISFSMLKWAIRESLYRNFNKEIGQNKNYAEWSIEDLYGTFGEF